MRATPFQLILLALAAGAGCVPRAAAPELVVTEEPRPQNPAFVALGATELECDRERVTVNEFLPVIQISGCEKVVYFEQKSRTELERVGPEYALAPEDDLHQAQLLEPPGTKLTPPVQLSGKEPALTVRQMQQLTSWNPKAKAICILGVNGRLNACLVLAQDPLVGEVVAQSLPTRLYQPVAIHGGPRVPSPYVVNVNVDVPRPNCRHLSSPMLRAQCERAVTQGGPATMHGDPAPRLQPRRPARTAGPWTTSASASPWASRPRCASSGTIRRRTVPDDAHRGRLAQGDAEADVVHGPAVLAGQSGGSP